MDENQYLNERLKDQIDWYCNKSQYNQKVFKRLKFVEIICAAFIPFVAASGEKFPYGVWVTGVLGIFIAVSAAVGALCKFHENWIEYRTTAEQLKHEKFLYLTNTKPYDTTEKFSILVQRTEGLISKENSSWVQLTKSKQAVSKITE